MADLDFPQWVLALVSSLRGASHLHLATASGTDLTLVVEGRPFEFSRGSDDRATAWVAPVEHLGEGRLVATHKGIAVELVVRNGLLVSGTSQDPETQRAIERLLADAPEGRRIRLLGWCLRFGAAPTHGVPLRSAFVSFGLYPQPGPTCGASESNFNLEAAGPELTVFMTDGSGCRILDGHVELI